MLVFLQVECAYVLVCCVSCVSVLFTVNISMFFYVECLSCVCIATC